MSDLPTFLSSLLEARAGRGEKIIAAAQKGSVQTLKDYFRAHRARPYVDGDQLQILRQMIEAPAKFHRKPEVIEAVLDAGFDPFKFFKTIENSYPQFETDMWKFYARDPKPETARAGGMLLAEFIRYRVCTKDSYKLPAEKLFPDEQSLTSVHGACSTRDSVLAMQNALVDYIVESGPGLPLNRAAAMLLEMKDSPDAELWMRKVADISASSIYSIEKGDIRSVKVDYSPI